MRERIKDIIDQHFIRQDQREPIKVKRRTYLLLALMTGFFGGHRFYSKRYLSGILCLLFFWTGVPLVNAIVDIMIMLPKNKEMDEEGYVFI